MKLRELFKENISDKDIQRLKQDAAQIKAMKDSGNADLNKLMPMMKNMAYTAARADMGSKLLEFMQKMAGLLCNKQINVGLFNFEYMQKIKAENSKLKRPDFWGGYIVKPSLWEFWQGNDGFHITFRAKDSLRR